MTTMLGRSSAAFCVWAIAVTVGATATGSAESLRIVLFCFIVLVVL